MLARLRPIQKGCAQ
ncbi:hypothetical protein ACQVAO_005326 [Escherichia coli]